MMVKVAVIGDGYTAADLARLLAFHGGAEISVITSADHVGRRFSDLYPHLTGIADIVMEPTRVDNLKGRVEAAFLALPHGLSVPLAAELARAGIRCIDLGADFRLRDAALYKEYYHLEHERPDLLAGAVYGLPEIYRDKIRDAAIVANPGCYPTGAILALAPLLRAGVIEAEDIIVDSKSGVSGAGRGLSLNSHFCEAHESIKAYGIGGHRHQPEIEQELSAAAGLPVQITFTPHLVPMNRGILTTAYARKAAGAAAASVREALVCAYAGERFVKVLPEGVYPQTKWVYGTNYVQIGLCVNEKNGRVIVVSAIDNLTKGASGQAVQNLNLMFGLDEGTGLLMPGIFP